jgi:hypothetical protein
MRVFVFYFLYNICAIVTLLPFLYCFIIFLFYYYYYYYYRALCCVVVYFFFFFLIIEEVHVHVVISVFV